MYTVVKPPLESVWGTLPPHQKLPLTFSPSPRKAGLSLPRLSSCLFWNALAVRSYACRLLHLASSTEHNAWESHLVAACVRGSFLFITECWESRTWSTTICLSFSNMWTRVVSSLGYWTKNIHLQIFMWTYLGVNSKEQWLLDYSRVGLLGHRASIGLTWQKMTKCFRSDYFASSPASAPIFDSASFLKNSHFNLGGLISTFLVKNNTEHCLMCLSATCITSLVKYLLKSFAQFL